MLSLERQIILLVLRSFSVQEPKLCVPEGVLVDIVSIAEQCNSVQLILRWQSRLQQDEVVHQLSPVDIAGGVWV